MSEENFTLNIETVGILNPMQMQEPLKTDPLIEPLILPGILHYAKRKHPEINYLTLLKHDRGTASRVFSDYFKLCHSPDHDPYEYSVPYEAVMQNQKMVDQLDSFRDGECTVCGFYNIRERKLKIPEECDQWAKAFYADFIKKMKPKERRNMQPVRGKYTWTYQCEKCFKKKK